MNPGNTPNPSARRKKRPIRLTEHEYSLFARSQKRLRATLSGVWKPIFQDHRRFANYVMQSKAGQLRAPEASRDASSIRQDGQQIDTRTLNPSSNQWYPELRRSYGPAGWATGGIQIRTTELSGHISRKCRKFSSAGSPRRHRFRRCRRLSARPLHTNTNGGYMGKSPRKWRANNVACIVGSAHLPTRLCKTVWATSVSL